jgi:hypothetical protein
MLRITYNIGFAYNEILSIMNRLPDHCDGKRYFLLQFLLLLTDAKGTGEQQQ